MCIRDSGIEVQELQIELGNRKTEYEEFKYTLQSNYSIKDVYKRQVLYIILKYMIVTLLEKVMLVE